MKIVFDLDGTICFKGKPLTKMMINALDRLAEEGFEIIFASARPIRDLLPVIPLHMHHYPMVGGNGAFVATGGNIVSTIHFERSTADAFIQLIRTFKADYLIDSSWDYAYSGDLEHPIRRNVDPEQRAINRTIDELSEIVKAVILRSVNPLSLLEGLKNLPVVIHEHGQEGILDISPKGVDKWAGLQKLGIGQRQFIAFGNDANDLSMFKHAGHSVCVGEHAELLRIATDHVSNDEEHVVRKIMEMLMVEKI